MLKGGKQGGSDVPRFFAKYFDYSLKSMVDRWDRLGYGIQGLRRRHHHYIWADDIVLACSSVSEAQSMVNDLHDALANAGLTVQQRKFHWMAVNIDTSDEVLVTPYGATVAEQSLRVLGVTLDASGKSGVAVHDRISVAWKHYWARSQVLQSRYISLESHVRRWAQTVLKTKTWGAGAWTASQSEATLLAYNCHLTIFRMMRIPRHRHEPWLDWYRRIHRQARAKTLES